MPISVPIIWIHTKSELGLLCAEERPPSKLMEICSVVFVQFCWKITKQKGENYLLGGGKNVKLDTLKGSGNFFFVICPNQPFNLRLSWW